MKWTLFLTFIFLTIQGGVCEEYPVKKAEINDVLGVKVKTRVNSERETASEKDKPDEYKDFPVEYWRYSPEEDQKKQN